MRLKIPLVFIWVGFVSAISFMEAWLKFTTPGVSLTTGLAIGQVVFSALNKVELLISLCIGVLLTVENRAKNLSTILIALPIMILLVQTFYALPLLSSRVDIYLAGGIPEHSNLHFSYFIMEVIKVLALIIYGIYQLKK